MLQLLLESGSAFPDAVIWSLPYLKPIETHTLYGLKKSDHIAKYPTTVFELLKQIVRDGSLPMGEKYILRETLDSLRQADPQIGTDLEFHKLYQIATH